MTIVDEIQSFLSTSSVNYKEFYPVGEATDKEKEKINKFLHQAMERDRSHLVAGSYTMGNIVDRPNKYYVLLGDFEGGILLNVASDRSWVIALDYKAKKEHYEYFRNLVGSLSKIFLAASGKAIIDQGNLLLQSNNMKRALYNTVFELEEFAEDLISKCNDKAEVLMHPSTEEVFQKVKSFYNYDTEKMENLRKTQFILALDSEIVAGARSNEEIGDFAVIGGVRTNLDYRKQGLGFTICFHLIRYLSENFKTVTLETDDDNFPAIRIYENLGFVKVGPSAFFEKGMEMIEVVIGERDY